MRLRIESVITAEGLSERTLPPGILKGNEYLGASEYLFKFVLNDDDSRWSIIDRYVQAKHEAKFKRLNFENALSAIYLSNEPSYRNGYASFITLENIRHLCRAVNNVSAYPLLQKLYQSTTEVVPLPDNLSVEFARTNRILSGTDKRGVTGCPEALYQLRMFLEGKYIARIGFNAHPEGESTVLSITNIQGVPSGVSYYDSLYEQFNFRPFNTLIRRLKLFADESPDPIELRGLKNPANIACSGLYNSVFKLEGIQRFSFKRIRSCDRQEINTSVLAACAY